MTEQQERERRQVRRMVRGNKAYQEQERECWDIWECGDNPRCVDGPYYDHTFALDASEDRTQQTKRTHVTVLQGSQYERRLKQGR